MQQIEEKEKNLTFLNHNLFQLSGDLPWFSIFTSLPFISIAVAHTCEGWAFGLILTSYPKYLSEALNYRIFKVSEFYYVLIRSYSGVSLIQNLICSNNREIRAIGSILQGFLLNEDWESVRINVKGLAERSFRFRKAKKLPRRWEKFTQSLVKIPRKNHTSSDKNLALKIGPILWRQTFLHHPSPPEMNF